MVFLPKLLNFWLRTLTYIYDYYYWFIFIFSLSQFIKCVPYFNMLLFTIFLKKPLSHSLGFLLLHPITLILSRNKYWFIWLRISLYLWPWSFSSFLCHSHFTKIYDHFISYFWSIFLKYLLFRYFIQYYF